MRRSCFDATIQRTRCRLITSSAPGSILRGWFTSNYTRSPHRRFFRCNCALSMSACILEPRYEVNLGVVLKCYVFTLNTSGKEASYTWLHGSESRKKLGQKQLFLTVVTSVPLGLRLFCGGRSALMFFYFVLLCEVSVRRCLESRNCLAQELDAALGPRAKTRIPRPRSRALFPY
ncbi:hypothetical protein BV22DRAFT_808361 [Leucogyrophana mollusca]|uniref:Uncharacterized protein n=1 Tax=Leucogyrophana mollusca TaxID=85980 RepID=A0ACB8B5K0_9AGAM|nr:hypothetical protein BV22DRAFT_808361 [Leucogyrophana mollusca]